MGKSWLRTSAIDRNRTPLFWCTDLTFVHGDRQHSILEIGFDRILVGIIWQIQDTLEAPIGAFDAVKATLILFLLLTLLTTHYQHVVVEGDLDILLLNTGKFQSDLVLFVGFLDVQGRLQHARPVGWQARHGQCRKSKSPKSIIEQTINLAMQLQDWTDRSYWHRHIIALHRQTGRGGLLLLLLFLEPVPGRQLLEVNIHVTPPNREDFSQFVRLLRRTLSGCDKSCSADFCCSRLRITSFFVLTCV